jgi:alcohol dehydrogenase (cytochrome c)
MLGAHLAALDTTSGQVVWDTTVDGYTRGAYLTPAPQVAKGKVMVGMAGGEDGLRDYIAASELISGVDLRRLWLLASSPAVAPGAVDSSDVMRSRR